MSTTEERGQEIKKIIAKYQQGVTNEVSNYMTVMVRGCRFTEGGMLSEIAERFPKVAMEARLTSIRGVWAVTITY